MKPCHSLALLFAASLAVAGVAIGYPALGAAPAAAPPAGGGLQILEFKPAMDDLMTMLIQPRHMKLYYAGQQQNWTLAGFELNELGAALRRIGQTIPKYRNISVDATVQSIFAPKIQAMTAATEREESGTVQHCLCRPDRGLQHLPPGFGTSVPCRESAGRAGFSRPGFPPHRSAKVAAPSVDVRRIERLIRFIFHQQRDGGAGWRHIHDDLRTSDCISDKGLNAIKTGAQPELIGGPITGESDYRRAIHIGNHHNLIPPIRTKAVIHLHFERSPHIGRGTTSHAAFRRILRRNSPITRLAGRASHDRGKANTQRQQNCRFLRLSPHERKTSTAERCSVSRW